LDAYRELSCQVRALSCGKRLTARIFGNIQVHVRNKQCLSLPLRIFAPWRLCVNCSLLQAGISHAKAQSRKEKPQSTTLLENQHSNPPFRRRRLQTFRSHRHTQAQPRILAVVSDRMSFFTLRNRSAKLTRLVFAVAMFAFVFSMAVVRARAQQPDDVITTDTSLVQLNVGVVDKQGNAITNWSQNDFSVFEDGKRRPIVHFEPADAPFSLVMMLDMSGSTVIFRQQIRGAALRFLDALDPEDRVAVVEFNGKGVKS